MTAGAKLLLLIVTLMIGVAVVYYGFYLSPDSSSEVPKLETPEAGSTASKASTGPKKPTTAGSSGLPSSGRANTPPPASRTSRMKTFGSAGTTDGGDAGSANRIRPANTPSPGTGLFDRSTPAAERAVKPSSSSATKTSTPAGESSGSEGTSRFLRSGPRSMPSTVPEPKSEPKSEPKDTPSPGISSIPRPPAPTARGRTWTVVEGDTLGDIAFEHYGRASQWKRIAAANPSINPDRLKPGMVLTLPPKDTSDKPAKVRPSSSETPDGVQSNRGSSIKQSGPVHVVAEGETLSDIAEKYYGTQTAWLKLYDANKAAIGDNPDRLKVGMRLVIPPKG